MFANANLIYMSRIKIKELSQEKNKQDISKIGKRK